jgi:hypothetical protein
LRPRPVFELTAARKPYRQATHLDPKQYGDLLKKLPSD